MTMAAFIGATFQEARAAPHIRHAQGGFKAKLRGRIAASDYAAAGCYFAGAYQAIAVAVPRNINA